MSPFGEAAAKRAAGGARMRPSNLIYSVDESPPALVCLVNAAQQLTIITPFLIYPILVMRAVGADEAGIANFVGAHRAHHQDRIDQERRDDGELLRRIDEADRAAFPSVLSGRG